MVALKLERTTASEQLEQHHCSMQVFQRRWSKTLVAISVMKLSYVWTSKWHTTTGCCQSSCIKCWNKFSSSDEPALNNQHQFKQHLHILSSDELQQLSSYHHIQPRKCLSLSVDRFLLSCELEWAESERRSWSILYLCKGLLGHQSGETICLSLIHISEPTRRYAISYAVFCLKKKK